MIQLRVFHNKCKVGFIGTSAMFALEFGFTTIQQYKVGISGNPFFSFVSFVLFYLNHS